jgi:intracellular sulfur oxidation DsrE/DsrF family protein
VTVVACHDAHRDTDGQRERLLAQIHAVRATLLDLAPDDADGYAVAHGRLNDLIDRLTETTHQ